MKPLRPTHPYIPMARGFVYLVRVMELSAQRPTYGPDPDLNLIQIPPADHSRIERGTCTSSCSVTRVERGQTSVELYEPPELQRITRG